MAQLIPMFDVGEDPELWLQSLEDYFEEYHISMACWIEIAFHGLKGEAAVWGRVNHSRLSNDWCAFNYELLWEFAPKIKPLESGEAQVVDNSSVLAVAEVSSEATNSAVTECNASSSNADKEEPLINIQEVIRKCESGDNWSFQTRYNTACNLFDEMLKKYAFYSVIIARHNVMGTKESVIRQQCIQYSDANWIATVWDTNVSHDQHLVWEPGDTIESAPGISLVDSDDQQLVSNQGVLTCVLVGDIFVNCQIELVLSLPCFAGVLTLQEADDSTRYRWCFDPGVGKGRWACYDTTTTNLQQNIVVSRCGTQPSTVGVAKTGRFHVCNLLSMLYIYIFKDAIVCTEAYYVECPFSMIGGSTNDSSPIWDGTESVRHVMELSEMALGNYMVRTSVSRDDGIKDIRVLLFFDVVVPIDNLSNLCSGVARFSFAGCNYGSGNVTTDWWLQCVLLPKVHYVNVESSLVHVLEVEGLGSCCRIVRLFLHQGIENPKVVSSEVTDVGEITLPGLWKADNMSTRFFYSFLHLALPNIELAKILVNTTSSTIAGSIEWAQFVAAEVNVIISVRLCALGVLRISFRRDSGVIVETISEWYPNLISSVMLNCNLGAFNLVYSYLTEWWHLTACNLSYTLGQSAWSIYTGFIWVFSFKYSGLHCLLITIHDRQMSKIQYTELTSSCSDPNEVVKDVVVDVGIEYENPSVVNKPANEWMEGSGALISTNYRHNFKVRVSSFYPNQWSKGPNSTRCAFIFFVYTFMLAPWMNYGRTKNCLISNEHKYRNYKGVFQHNYVSSHHVKAMARDYFDCIDLHNWLLDYKQQIDSWSYVQQSPQLFIPVIYVRKLYEEMLASNVVVSALVSMLNHIFCKEFTDGWANIHTIYEPPLVGWVMNIRCECTRDDITIFCSLRWYLGSSTYGLVRLFSDVHESKSASYARPFLSTLTGSRGSNKSQFQHSNSLRLQIMGSYKDELHGNAACSVWVTREHALTALIEADSSPLGSFLLYIMYMFSQALQIPLGANCLYAFLCSIQSISVVLMILDCADKFHSNSQFSSLDKGFYPRILPGFHGFVDAATPTPSTVIETQFSALSSLYCNNELQNFVPDGSAEIQHMFWVGTGWRGWYHGDRNIVLDRLDNSMCILLSTKGIIFTPKDQIANLFKQYHFSSSPISLWRNKEIENVLSSEAIYVSGVEPGIKLHRMGFEGFIYTITDCPRSIDATLLHKGEECLSGSVSWVTFSSVVFILIAFYPPMKKAKDVQLNGNSAFGTMLLQMLTQ